MPNTDDRDFNRVDSAAGSLEERELLAPIVDNPGDLDARRAYHQWLKTAKDRRGGFSSAMLSHVKEFSKSTQHSHYVSAPTSGFAEAWTNMLGFPLFRGIANHAGLWEVRDLVLRYARPRLSITPELLPTGKPPIRASRLGGRASLPADQPWPEYAEGPLDFLGQIALREIRNTQVARFLPDSGWLAIFADANGVYGTKGDTQVIYIREDQELAWRKNPDEDKEANAGPPCRLIFTESWDLPPDDGDLVVSEDDQQRLKAMKEASPENGALEMITALHPGMHQTCHLLGYARHYRTSDPSPGPEWQNLLCLGSVDALGWSWCDGEHLAIFIRNDHLQAHDFSQVSGYAS